MCDLCWGLCWRSWAAVGAFLGVFVGPLLKWPPSLFFPQLVQQDKIKQISWESPGASLIPFTISFQLVSSRFHVGSIRYIHFSIKMRHTKKQA